MLLLLASLAIAAPTVDAIDETAESPFAADATCVRSAPTMSSIEAEAVYAFTLGTEEIGDLQSIEIEVRSYRQNCRVDMDEFEIYIDNKSLYKDDTLGLTSEGDGTVSSPDWRQSASFTVSDIEDEIVTAGDHEIRAVLRGAGDNENNKIEIRIIAEWEHGSDWDGDTYTDDRLTGGDDCDDRNADVSPGATEVWYDNFDQNCDGWSDFDQDFDGFDSADETAEGTDCNDLVDSVNPDATEIWYDGEDRDCDGWSDYDQDRDGFDSSEETDEGEDCDDLVAAVNPDATEVWYDGVDQDCDAWSDFDQDFDGFDSSDETDEGEDCDDLEAAVNPDATEVWYDGVDQDCDGWSDFDQDRDGFDSPDHEGDDCDDLDASAFPGARNFDENCERAVRDDGTRPVPPAPPVLPTGCSCESSPAGGSIAWLAGLAWLLGIRRRR